MRIRLFLVLFCVAFSVTAQKYRNFNVFKKSIEPSNNERIALVIANSDYNHGKLDKPVAEAEQIVNALTQQGFDVEVGYNLDYNAMRQTVFNFSRQFPKYKSGVVYYAGHGFQIDGQNYLVPTNTPQTDVLFELKNSLVNVNFVFDAINDPDKPKLLILDACRNNPFKEKLSSAYRSADDNGFSEIQPKINSEIIFSTAPGTKVSDDNPFTRIFSEEILVGGCFDDIARRTNKRVRELDPRQVMTVKGFLEDEFCFGEQKKEDPDPIDPTPPDPDPDPDPIKKDDDKDNMKARVEVLSWLQGKLKNIYYDQYEITGMLSHNYTQKFTYSMEYDAETCMVTITEVDFYEEDRNSTRNDHNRTSKYQFSLADIGSIAFEDNYFRDYFVIKTFNSKEAIKKKPYWTEEFDRSVTELRIQFDELGDLKGAPERFVNAFQDAMKFCGAKKEKY